MKPEKNVRVESNCSEIDIDRLARALVRIVLAMDDEQRLQDDPASELVERESAA